MRGVHTQGPRASASAVSLLAVAVAATATVQIDRTCAHRRRLRQAEQRHARGPDPPSEDGDHLKGCQCREP